MTPFEIGLIALAVMVVLPVLGSFVRWTTGDSLAGLGLYVQSFNLWLAFTGAAIASRRVAREARAFATSSRSSGWTCSTSDAPSALGTQPIALRWLGLA